MHRLLASIGVAVVIGLAVSVPGFSLISMFRPVWLHTAGPVVCPEGTSLQLRNASPVPGELVLEAECTGGMVAQDVTAKLIFTVAGAFVVRECY